jgi:hypothetical protein
MQADLQLPSLLSFDIATVGSFVEDVRLVTGAARLGLHVRVVKRQLTDVPCGDL